MDDALGVRRIERIRDLNSDIDDLIERQRPAGNAMLQRHPIQELHGDEPLAIAFIDLMNGANVRVIQRRGSLRLALEASERLRILGHRIRKEFQRDEAMQLRVLGLIDNAHTTAAKFFDDAVVRYGLADHVR